MKGRMRRQPEHESPHDWRLQDIVLECGVLEAEVPRYVEFARELSVTLHRVPLPDFDRAGLTCTNGRCSAPGARNSQHATGESR